MLNDIERAIVREGAEVILRRRAETVNRLAGEIVDNLSYKPEGLSSPEHKLRAMKGIVQEIEVALRCYREAQER